MNLTNSISFENQIELLTGKKLLFVGDSPQKSSPLVSLANEIQRRCAVDVCYANGLEYEDTGRWLRMVREVDAVLFISYDGPNSFIVRQLALAAARGRPLIRWWVGSDVLHVLRSSCAANNARTIERLLFAQIAVSPHLVDELASIGIHADYVPSVIRNSRSVRTGSSVDQLPNGVLVYLPSNRRVFYGEGIVARAVQKHSDVPFYILADETHSFRDFCNVRSLGWVDDIEPLWDSIGVLLRITEHDGMPRMVLDALRRGKQVIYSWPFAGCILAKTFDEVDLAILRFKELRQVNFRGITVADEIMSSDPVGRILRILGKAIYDRGHRMVGGLAIALSETVKQKLARTHRRRLVSGNDIGDT